MLSMNLLFTDIERMHKFKNIFFNFFMRFASAIIFAYIESDMHPVFIKWKLLCNTNEMHGMKLAQNHSEILSRMLQLNASRHFVLYLYLHNFVKVFICLFCGFSWFWHRIVFECISTAVNKCKGIAFSPLKQPKRLKLSAEILKTTIESTVGFVFVFSNGYNVNKIWYCYWVQSQMRGQLVNVICLWALFPSVIIRIAAKPLNGIE